jgi:prephenate dehydratase
VPGAFGEGAALDFAALYFDGPASELPAPPVGLPTFEAVVAGVAAGDFSRGVLPIEDSLTGTVHGVHELLLREPGVRIVGELTRHTDHCLCALPGGAHADVAAVASHPAILAQCAGYLARLDAGRRAEGGSGVALVPSMNSAASAQTLAAAMAPAAGAGPVQGVICSARAAELYGLDVLDATVADTPVATRYVALGRPDEQPPLPIGARVKSSIVLAIPNEPMALFRTLAATALRDINLTKVESRPAAALAAAGFGSGTSFAPWEYVFYVDMEVAARAGGASETATKQLDLALTNLAEFATDVAEIGRYAGEPKTDPKTSSHRDLYR